MKAIFFILFLIVSSNTLVVAQKKSTEFMLQGEINSNDSTPVIITYIDKDGTNVIDTIFTKNGKFHFRGQISEPTLAKLHYKSMASDVYASNYLQFFLEPTKMKISLVEGQLEQANILGSKTQKQFETLKEFVRPVFDSAKVIDALIHQLKSDKTITKEVYAKQAKPLFSSYTIYKNVLDSLYFCFVKLHPNSFISPYILYNLVNILKVSKNSANMYYNTLGISAKNSYYGKLLFNKLKAWHKIKKGDYVADFIGINRNGEEIRLSNYKDKSYILLDFWASWCIPCRQQAPTLKLLNNSYSNLQIISLSVDNNRASWLNAIKKDGINMWQHILIGNDATNLKFGIEAFPTYVLIDSNGKIIDIYVGDMLALEQTLKFLLKN